MKSTIPLEIQVRIASTLVHFDEFCAADGDPADLAEARRGLLDPSVRSWLRALQAQGLLPVRRDGVTY